MLFRSKIDWWFVLIMVCTTILTVFPIFYFWQHMGTFSYGYYFRLLILLVAIFFIYYTVWLQFFNTKYIIFDNKLFIKCGFYNKNIELDSIIFIKSMKSFSSSPALSTDRVYIKYIVNGFPEELFISPKNKEYFIEILLKKKSKIN